MIKRLMMMIYNSKIIGKIMFALAGILYPLTLIIYYFKTDGFNNTTALWATVWLVALLAYALVPFMIKNLKWDIIWSTIFSVIGILYLINWSEWIAKSDKTTFNIFVLVFVIILVLGSGLWMMQSMMQYFKTKDLNAPA